MRITEQGIPFFIDHNTKSTTYNHPRTGRPVGPLGGPGLQMASDKTFKNKVAQFRYLCYVSCFFNLKNTKNILQSNAFPKHVKISVTRQNLFEDSFQEVLSLRQIYF